VAGLWRRGFAQSANSLSAVQNIVPLEEMFHIRELILP